jgi:hypothetical protein
MFNEQNTVENYVVNLSPQPPFLKGKGESGAIEIRCFSPSLVGKGSGDG